MTTELPALPAGWARPATAQKHHYFPASELRSLCMRWMFGTGDGDARDDRWDDHGGNCAECKRKVKAYREQHGQEVSA